MRRIATLWLVFFVCVVPFAFAGGGREAPAPADAGEADMGTPREMYYDADVYKEVTELLFESDAPRFGGTLRLPIASSPQSFNFYGTLGRCRLRDHLQHAGSAGGAQSGDQRD